MPSMNRRGPLSLSMLLIAYLLIGHIPSHMVRSSDYSDNASNAEDDERDPQEGFSPGNSDQISISSNADTEDLVPENREGNDQTSVAINNGTDNIENGNKEENGHTSAIINGRTGNKETGNKEGNRQTPTIINGRNGDVYTWNKEGNKRGEDIYELMEAHNYQKENFEEYRERTSGSLYINTEEISNLHNNTTSHTNDVYHEYQLELRLSALLLISALFGYRKSKQTLRTKKQSLNDSDSDSRRHKELEKRKNALNTDLNDAGMPEEKLKSYSVQVQRKREIILLPPRFSRESTSTQYCPLSFGETPVEISRHDLLDYLQSKKYDINEVVSLESSYLGNVHRISADRSVSDIVREKIPDTCLSTMTIQKINKRGHERSEGRGINDNTCRGGNQGEVLVISYEYTKTDINENALYLRLMNLKSKELKVRSISKRESSSAPYRETPVEISKSDLLDNIKTQKHQIREVMSIEDFHSGNIQRISADRSVLDIVREMIPGNGSSKVTVQQINTRTRGRSEGQIINDNTNKGGNQGAAVVISFDGSKADIHKHVSDFELRNLISKGFRFSNFTSKTDSQKSHGSEATEVNTEVGNNRNQSKYLYVLGSLNKSDKKKNDVKEKELLQEKQNLLDKFSDDAFDKGLFTGERNASPMDSFKKGKFGNFNPRTTEMHSTQSETMLINLRSYKKFPTGFITNDEVRRELLASSLNILRRKGLLRDRVPPNVIDLPLELPTEDFRRELRHTFQSPTSSEWPNHFNANMSNYILRYASFSNWPIDTPFSATRLVTAGFFHDSQKCVICCFNCGIEVKSTGDQLKAFAKHRITPLQFHLVLNPRCEYASSEMLRNGNVNIPNITTTSEKNAHERMNNLCVTDQKSSSAPVGVPGSVGKDEEITERGRDILTDNVASYPGVVNSDNNIPENRQVRHNHHGSFNPHDSPSGRTKDVHNGAFEYNYPVKSPAYNDSYSRLESYRGWPTKNIQDPKELVNAGFFYTKKKDIVRCFCCDIGLAEWGKDDDPWLEHARHSPDCKYLKEKQSQDYFDSIQLEWQKIYKPKYPAYNELQTRLDSFTGWPEELTQRPDVLAAAGFFFTGEGDVARCHYCDGGLREWEPGDDPWTEHARWFPYCKYLIKHKGLEYIEQITRQSESGQREQSSGQSNQLSVFSDDSILTNHQSNSQQQITNNRENPMDTTAAETLLAMGYKRHEVQYVINRFVANQGNRHFTTENLLDIIMDMEDRGETIPETSANDGNTNGISNENIEPHLVQLENNRLKEQMLCVTCKREDRRMLLIPCGHRLHCESCSQSVKRCPNCKKRVNKIVKTFLA